MRGSIIRKSVYRAAGLMLGLMLTGGMVFAQMHPVEKESGIRFVIKNFGFNSNGSLGAPEGEIVFNPNDLAGASFHITVKAESINTDNESRDEHLRSEDYFDVKKYPLIRFVSSSVRAGDKKDNYTLTGSLTLKGKSKEISFPFTAEKKGNGYLFTGSFKMNRRDFGVGGSSTLSNELTVNISVLAQ